MTGALKPTAGLAALLTGVVLAGLASLALGSLSISLSDVVGAFTGFDDSDAQVIVRDVRGPRTLVAMAVGAGLGAAGAVAQGVTRNPLADPGILGISMGASFFVVAAIFVLGISSALGYVWFAFVGSVVAGITVYGLGATGSSNRAAPINLALAGAAVAALFGALTSSVLVVDTQTLNEFRFWMVGSVAGRDLDTLAVAGPFMAIGLIGALLAGRALNALALGEDVAQALGQRVARTRAVLLASFVLLSGGAVALAGPIAFVGLIVPHIARGLVGADYRWVVPYSILIGAMLITVADVIGRIVARPDEIQVGIVMAVLGVPVFIALVRRKKLAEV